MKTISQREAFGVSRQCWLQTLGFVMAEHLGPDCLIGELLSVQVLNAAAGQEALSQHALFIVWGETVICGGFSS